MLEYSKAQRVTCYFLLFLLRLLLYSSDFDNHESRLLGKKQQRMRNYYQHESFHEECLSVWTVDSRARSKKPDRMGPFLCSYSPLTHSVTNMGCSSWLLAAVTAADRMKKFRGQISNNLFPNSLESYLSPCPKSSGLCKLFRSLRLKFIHGQY